MAGGQQITQILVAWRAGDPSALEDLIPLVYHELHRMARIRLSSEPHNQILQPTALVNEAVVRLLDWEPEQWRDRAHFLGVCATLMRHVAVHYARQQHSAKRGGKHLRVSLSEATDVKAQLTPDVMAVDAALEDLERLDARQARVVELRCFGGLSLDETAEVMDISVSTVRRDWRIARAWLHQQLADVP